MNKTEKQIAHAADRFAKRWEGKGYEKGESQVFWLELLTEVFGVEEPSMVISFEDQVKLDHTSFIDGYIDHTHTMIEQKSLDKDLRAPIKQSDGTFLTPFQQAQRYSAALPYSKRPRWIVTCNFSTFLVSMTWRIPTMSRLKSASPTWARSTTACVSSSRRVPSTLSGRCRCRCRPVP